MTAIRPASRRALSDAAVTPAEADDEAGAHATLQRSRKQQKQQTQDEARSRGSRGEGGDHARAQCRTRRRR
eukprot:218091-Pleurochrysis_carterae.AAC.1